MKISYQTVKQFIVEDFSLSYFISLIYKIGFEIQSRFDFVPSSLDLVVIGKITSVKPHPNADRLNVYTVEVENDIYQIVCGDQTLKAETKVPLAKIGSQINHKIIKQSKIRGIESCGMLCSKEELNFFYIPKEEKNIIWRLPNDAIIGQSIKSLMGKDDTWLDLNIPTNRYDCLSSFGIAREMVLFDANLNLKFPSYLSHPVQAEQSSFVSIDPVVQDDILHFSYLIIENIPIEESSNQIKEYLAHYNQHPINNLVDLINIISAELGQPFHALDLDKVEGIMKITKQPHYIIETFSNITISSLDSDIITIDSKKPLNLNGIIGDQRSCLDSNTKRILIEAASFNPKTILKSMQNHKIQTEASKKMSKKVEPHFCIIALNYLEKILIDIFPSLSIIEKKTIKTTSTTPISINLSFDQIQSKLGFDFPQEQYLSIIKKLAFQYQQKDHIILLQPHYYRTDLLIEEDIMEELLRIYGYENIPSKIPHLPIIKHQHNQLFDFQIKQCLINLGIQEIYSYSLIDSEWLPHPNDVSILNPISSKLGKIRPSVLDSLLIHITQPTKNKIFHHRIFEVGWGCTLSDNHFTQHKELGLIIGGQNETYWDVHKKEYDFYSLKAIVEQIFYKLNISITYDIIDQHPLFHPKYGLTIFSQQQKIGILGEIHPSITKKFKLKAPLFACQLNLDVIQNLPISHSVYQEFSRYPKISRELPLITPQTVSFKEIQSLILQNFHDIINIDVKDIYQDESISNTQKAIALKIEWQSADHTLQDQYINENVDQILRLLNIKYQIQLREIK